MHAKIKSRRVEEIRFDALVEISKLINILNR